MKAPDFYFNDYFNNSNNTQINNYELYNIKDNYYQKENFENDFHGIFEDSAYFTEIFNEKDKHQNDKNNKIEQENIDESINYENYTISEKEKTHIKDDENFKIFLEKKRGKKESHTKFADDNLISKVKRILIDILLDFTNYKLYEIYNGNIGRGIFVKKLLTLSKRNFYENKVQYNKEFLYKTLKVILSSEISSRYTLFPPEHNKNLIHQCLNEADESKREFFNKYFNLTFLECLEHFRGSKIIDELKGLERINSLDSKYKEDEMYLKHLKYYFNNFESIINKKRTRNRTNKIKNSQKNSEL